MKKSVKTLCLPLCVLIICVSLLAALPTISAAAEDREGALLPAYGALYDAIVEAMQNPPDENNYIPADLTGMSATVEDLQAALYRFTRLNPEYFYLTGQFAYYPPDENGFLRRILIASSCNGEELQRKRAEFDALTSPLFALRDDGWSDFETVLFYHDYLAHVYQYDTSYTISDPTGFLTQGRGVCNAYALTFQLVMNHFGIPCTYAECQSLNHIWNVVYLDGAWYHLDVTHDDPTPDRPGMARHRYFLTGAQTTAQLRNNPSDMVFGAQVAVSDDDHPLYSLLGEERVPCTNVGGTLYTVITTDEGPFLSTFNAASGTFDRVIEMPSKWYVVGGGSYYPGCFTTLVTIDKYILYFDSKTVKALDAVTLEQFDIKNGPDDSRIYGMKFEGDTLMAYLAASPNDSTYTPMPACIPGDIDRDSTLSIADVTALLGVISSDDHSIPSFIPDMNGDGVIQISDVTILLNMLSA